MINRKNNYKHLKGIYNENHRNSTETSCKTIRCNHQTKTLQKENTTLCMKLIAAEQSKASYKSELTMLKEQLSQEETAQWAQLSINSAMYTQHDAQHTMPDSKNAVAKTTRPTKIA